MMRTMIACLVLLMGAQPRAVPPQDPFHAERGAALAQVAWVEQAYAERLGPKGADWRARIKADERPLRASLDWFVRNSEGDQALRLAVPLAYFWTTDGRTMESRELLGRILALPSSLAPTAIRARGLYDAGTLAYADRDQAAARAFFDESVRIARRLQDNVSTATALLGLARVAFRDMDYASVRRYAEESGILRRDLGDQDGQGAAIHMLAAVARVQGQYDKAVELYEFSLAANRKAGWDVPVAAELFNLGYVRLRQGQLSNSRKFFSDSLQKYRELQDDVGIGYVLTGFASLAVEEKQPSRAARLYAAGLAILDRFNISFDPDDQLDIDHYSAKLLTLLSPDAFKAASAEGRTTSSERAIALALGAP